METINDNRIAPVQEDLIYDKNLRLNILKGFSKANRMDAKIATGVTNLPVGSWAKMKKDGTVMLPGVDVATASKASYLVWRGTEVFDSKATGNVTLIKGGGLLEVETDNVQAIEALDSGDLLAAITVDGNSTLAKTTNMAVACAEVVTVGEADASVVIKVLS